MKKPYSMTWSTYFMTNSLVASFRSKDVKSQTGACIVDRDNRIVSSGYNGLPRGCDDNVYYFWRDDDDSDVLNSKHTYVVHAEQNAIYNATKDVAGCTLYTTLYPCIHCAKAISQVGMSKVVYLDVKERHVVVNRAVGRILSLGGVEQELFYSETTRDVAFMEGLIELYRSTYDDNV